MKVLVLGAGIVGVTTAYELNRDGHEVTVIDRERLPASFTSYGNAGLFAPGHAYAWSSPAAPGILLRSLWRNDQALRLRTTADPKFWSWMRKFWQQCTAEKAALNTQRKARLCVYSLGVFHQTLARARIAYDGRQDGLLYLYRNQKALDGAAAKADLLRKEGCVLDVLGRDAIADKDPALGEVKEKFAGALYAPHDESGDCRLFARNMAKWLEGRGVIFKFGTTVTGFQFAGDRIEAVSTDRGRQTGDAVVLALGVYSPHLAQKLGTRLPIYPVKGYSITAPVAGKNNPPGIGGIDEENLIAYAPYGDRVRATATAEFSGYERTHSPEDFRAMLSVMRELFPNGANWEKSEYWAGLRPMTPEGTPILGQGRYRNLWFNTGQGHMGWTMSHGAARITADLVAGKKPQISLDGMADAA
ncbi:MAG: FAD-dependent oxidoreductase [Alphaproteobacteria bacterium]|nr:MAG: FAD-dependent oxidoreductase [Alphaproteobacteria bacterium]